MNLRGALQLQGCVNHSHHWSSMAKCHRSWVKHPVPPRFQAPVVRVQAEFLGGRFRPRVVPGVPGVTPLVGCASNNSLGRPRNLVNGL